MVRVNLTLPEGLHRKLSAAARKRRVSKSALLRQALEEYLDKNLVRPGVSCLDLVQDLVGCVEGPGSLSTHPCHLVGYGK